MKIKKLTIKVGVFEFFLNSFQILYLAIYNILRTYPTNKSLIDKKHFVKFIYYL